MSDYEKLQVSEQAVIEANRAYVDHPSFETYQSWVDAKEKDDVLVKTIRDSCGSVLELCHLDGCPCEMCVDGRRE
jgi:hypothetical protein